MEETTCKHNDFLRCLKNRMGAHLDSILIGGRWLKKQASSHINFLELKAVFLAFQALIPSVKGSHICFGIDYRTALSDINKLGGTRSQNLSNLAIELWNYALERNLIISAIHISGKLNILEDHKSRIFNDSIEWMLNPRIFRGVVARLGQPDIDLFASRVNHQIPEFVSWRPEPTAVATDAFNLTWNYHLSYLFPPFSLILLCLKKMQRDQAECILIAPVWKSRPWYPILLSMLSYQPLLLPQSWFLLKLPGTNKIHTFCT